MLTLSGNTRAVTLDATCDTKRPAGVGIDWKLPAPLQAGWWHGTLAFSAREGDDKGWVNMNLAVALDTPQKPAVSVMSNFVFPEKSFEPRQFEFWMYTSTPAAGVRVQPVYNQLWRYKRSWPILSLTLEQRDPPVLTADDPITLDLPVEKDGRVAIPPGLPPGIWSARGAMTKGGKIVVVGTDERRIEGPFTFDRWRRPSSIHLYATTPLKSIAFETPALFKATVLEHSIARPPATPIPPDRQLIRTTDPSKTETADLVMIGANLTGDAPTLPLVPNGKHLIVMTSWDDAAPTDLRCAEILNKRGYRPSFFMNENGGAMKFLDKLEALHVEVGSHCYHHPSLYEIPPESAVVECVAMRSLLERELKHPVISFGYPNGYFPAYDADGDYVLRAVQAAGYWSGRTTNTGEGNVELPGDLLTMKTDGFFGNKKELAAAWEQARQKEGAIFYFWGHSWQIGKTDEQWQQFDDFVAQFAHEPRAWYASQGEFSLWIWARKNVKFDVTQKAADKVTVRLMRPWLHPYLSAECPLTLTMPAGVERVTWQGKTVPVINGAVDLTWVSQ